MQNVCVTAHTPTEEPETHLSTIISEHKQIVLSDVNIPTDAVGTVICKGMGSEPFS